MIQHRFPAPGLAVVALCVAAILCCRIPTGLAQTPDRNAPACRVFGPGWSPTEREVWQRFVCRAEVADLRDWLPERRRLSGQFLAEVLSDAPWRAAIPRQGLRIRGAIFPERVLLDSVDMERALWLEDCVFEKEVFLSQTRSKRLISLDRSEFKAPLRMNGVKVDASVFLRDIVVAKEQQVEMWSAEITGPLYLSGAAIPKLFMQQAHVSADVVLKGVEIGYLQMSTAVFDRNLVIGMDDDRAPRMREMRAEGTRIGGRVAVTGAEIERPLSLRFALIEGNLEIEGGALPGFDITGATIKGELRLGPRGAGAVKWRGDGGSVSVLENATARAIRIDGEPWPPKLDLRGFQFQLLGDRGEAPASSPVTNPRRLATLIEWLERSRPYSPQPYQQLAQVLEAKGDVAAAREVRFAAREEERRAASGLLWIWLTAKWLVIGHGYHLERVWWSVIGLLVLGTLVVRLSGETKRNGLGSGVAFSFDRLLPVVKLREQNYKVELRPGVREYFYLHQIMGYVLATFLVAGLGELAK